MCAWADGPYAPGPFPFLMFASMYPGWTPQFEMLVQAYDSKQNVVRRALNSLWDFLYRVP